MNARRLALLSGAALLAVGAFAPAQAAPAKVAGSYKLTLQPDPLINAFSLADMKNCTHVRAESTDKRTIKMPRAGKLKVNLESPDPAGRGLVFDWDMYLLDDKGATLGSGTSAGPFEEVQVTLKKATPVTFIVCNLTGTNEGKVSYSLK